MRALSSTALGLILLLSTPSVLSNEITAYQWDFGDGTTSSEANPNHEYQQPGFYQVTLKAFVNDKLSYSKQHLVDAVSPTIKKFIILGENTAKVGENLSFTTELETTQPLQLNYIWTTQEGNEHSGSRYSFTAEKTGTFELSVSGFFNGRKVTTDTLSYTVSVADTTPTPTTPTDKTKQSDEGGGSLFWVLPALFITGLRRKLKS
ncbi:PKD domain-containing protein [Pseudoalteromonas phenolica]|uniref:PKD domain-containing protein n=1 Tax=Pseudoalteromonas phenolica TaxID=161398 RepID=A0A0S2K5G2_9GAMM|nr:PKD domain-containing protein [Pseudoalteromonas phenolica]ALO43738.1 hypothetical protein PP2015_3261 [Pseudoalteromonas phenolica]MBE0355090.1 hypothetical protein [Pseudoalteromonas phenolica O-BC30]RXE93288.1 PKD domain-containing protein [Pseudoalteromonas phenolica O-BC30]